MTLRSTTTGLLTASAACALFAIAPSAQAQTFTYTTAFSPAGTINSSTAGTRITTTNGSDLNGVTAPTTITITNFVLTAPVGNPTGTFNTPVSIAITLNDATKGIVNLTRTLTGTLTGTANNNSANLSLNLNQTTLAFPATPSSSGTYTLDNFFFFLPAPTASNNSTGFLTARATFAAGSAAPEPGTVALVGMGLVGLAGVARRRKNAA